MKTDIPRQMNERFWLQIPVTRHMGLRITAWDGRTLRMDAPLAPNLNDKGTGFAGSLATLVTFAGWALATLLAEDAASCPCEVAVFESDMQYIAPVTGDFYALVPVPDEDGRCSFERSLLQRGRARIALTASIFQEGEEKVRYRGKYAVRRKGAG
ncbi:MAG: YiiD C-terminal domain-containing protein [Syntrophotalea acetylenica]|nr:YiiD C-terminal domain-containing protein [Syntrophotalea acetylenica]APG42935.1 hypothetical protein A6070_01390 [Syntrophotalea acetylenica]MDD4457689.1 YiiD C-terminal domain-containing protein [Syntrophotalea acetylenica]MDY0261308.1 YiiD C-terminal domain-containing protein [Syntrophotalea acetylenica]